MRYAQTIVLAALALAGASAFATEVTVLKAARLFDAVSGKMQENGVVVVEGERILAVGPSAEVPVGAKVIDLGDATLLPGFIDAHVHLSDEMSDNWYRDFYTRTQRFPAEQAHHAARYAQRTLEAGFTTVRDLGSEYWIAAGLRNAINAGLLPGPRVLAANYAIGSTAGHADQAPFPPYLVAPADEITGVCNGADDCRAAARYQFKWGADVIKFMPSGGVLSLTDPVDHPGLTQEEMNAIVSEAHAWGAKAAAHCHGDLAAKMAIRAGTDSIEHGTFLKDDTLREMKKQGVYLVATLFAGEWVGSKADNYPPAIAEKARKAAAQMQETFQRAVKIGVPIAFGTDAGVEPHGANAREFVLMTRNGMAPADALLAATRNAAELLGIADETGTLEPGKAADIVVLPGDPLQDIGVTGRPKLVMKAGKVYFDRVE